MVLGIVGLVVSIWFVPSILGVVFGFIGRARARRGAATNGGQALAGIIMGFLGIALGVVLWVVLVRYGSGTDCSDDFSSYSCD